MNPNPESSTSSEPSPFQRACDCNANYIRNNPVATVLGALAAGLVVGWLLPHRRETWSERYVSGPMDRMRGWFASTADDLSESAHDMRGRASDLAAQAGEAVSKGIKKFRCW